VKLWSEIAEGETHALDSALLLALRVNGRPDQPIGPAWLPGVMVTLTDLGGGLVLGMVLIIACGYLLTKGARISALLLLASTLSGALIVVLLKGVFDRARPDIVEHLVPAQLMSFPSGHAANSALVYLTIGVIVSDMEKNAGTRVYVMAVAILLTLAIGASRVYLGIHWPSDVIGGWFFGAAWALACRIAASRWRGQRS
jgi:undecaprenyl-diphosphatase